MKEKNRRAGPHLPHARTVLRKAVAAVLTAGMIIPAVPASAKEASSPDAGIAQHYRSESSDSKELVVVNPDGKLKGKYGAGTTRTEGGMTYLTYGSHAKAKEALSSIRKKGFSADYNVSFETAAGETKKKSAPDGDEATRSVAGKTETVVAVIDTDIDRSDASLKGRIVRYDAGKKAFVKDDSSGRTQKKNSHGTNMAEIVAKSTPDTVSIYPLEVFDDSGKGDSGRTAQAVSQAAREKADVILMSISGKGGSKALQQAVDAAREAGADVIAAAGNKSDSAGDYVPGSLDGVITTGALDRDGNPASYSNMGSEVDYSLSGTYVGNDGNEIKGTSVSAARLAGYAAAIRSAAGKGYADSVLAKASKDIGSSGTNPLTGELLYGRSVKVEDVVESLKSTEGLKAEQGAHKKKTYMDGKGIDLVSLAMEVAWVSAIGSAPKGSTKGDATFYIGYYYLGNGKIGTNAYTGSGYTKLTGWDGKSYHQYLSKEDKTPLHSSGPLAYRSLNEAMDEAATKDGYDISGWQDKMRAWGAWEDQSRHVDNAKYRGNKYGIWKRKENGEIQTVTFVSLSDLNISSKHFVNINMLDMDNGNREVSNGDLGTFDYTPTSTASGITYHYRNISNEPNDNNYPANSTGWISNITGKNGYVLDHIEVNGTRSSNGSYTVGSGNVVINIYMKRPQYKVNINMLDEENGNVERSDGSIGSFDYIARPANGDGTIPENAYSAYYRISNEPGNTNYYYSGSTGKIPRVYGANGYALDRIEVNGKRDGSTWDGGYTVNGADVQINIYMRKPRINISMLDADNNNKESTDGSLGTFDLKLSNGEGWTALSDQPAEIGTQRSGGGSHLSPGQIVYVSNIVPAKGYILKNVRGAKYIDGKWTYIVTDKSDKHFINLYMTRRTDLSFDPNGGMGDVQKSKRPAGSQVLANGGSARFNGNIEKVDDTDSKSNPVTSIWTKFSYHRDPGSENKNTIIASNGFTKLYVDGAGRLAATVSTSSSNVGIQLTGSYLKQDTTYKVGLDMTDGKARLYVDGKSVAEKNLNGTLGTLHQVTDEEGTTKKYTKSNPATFNDRDNIYGLFTVHESHTYRLFVKAKRNRGTKPLKGGLWYHAYNGGGAAYDAYDMGGYQDGEWTNVGPAGDGYSLYYRDVTVPPGKSKARFYMQLEQQNNGDTSWSAYDMQVYEVRSTQSSSAQQNAVDMDASVSYDFIGGKLPVYTIGADVGENGRAGASEYFDSEDEGRAMSLDFLYYILTNPDVLKFYYPDYSNNVGIGAYNAGDWMKGAIAHFYRYGNQEGRASGMAFSAKEYASFYSDLFAASNSGKNGTWLAWHYGYYGIWEDPDRFGSNVMKSDAGQMNDAGNYVDINTIYFDQDKKHDNMINGSFDRILSVHPAKDGQKYESMMIVDGGGSYILPNGEVMHYTSLMMKGNGALRRWDIKTPERVGYEFEGWYTARSGGTRISETSATPSKATTYYAHWKAIPYPVSYNANGGKGSMPDSTAYYEKKFVTRKNAFTRKGYTFDGWKENDLGYYGRRWTLTTDGIWEYGNGAHPVTWDRPIGVTLYAQWKPNTYNVSYDANGGRFSGGTTRIPTKAVYDSSYTVTSSVPSRDGYEFRGWAYNDRSNPKNMKFGSTAESGHHPKDSFIWQHDGNVTYYASWNRKPGLTIKDPPTPVDPQEPTDNPDDPTPHDTTKLPPYIKKSSTSIIVQESYCRSSSTLLEYITPYDSDGTATVHVDTIDGKPVGKDNNPGKWTATHHYLVQYTVTDDEGAKTIVTIDYYVNKMPALTALSRGFKIGSYVSRTELMRRTGATDYEDDRDGKKLTIRLWKVIYQNGHAQRPAKDGTLDLDTSKEQKAHAFISVTDSMGATRYGAFEIDIYPLNDPTGSKDDNYIRFTSEDAFRADGGSGFDSVMQGDLKSAFDSQRRDSGDTAEIDLQKKATVTLPDGTKKQMTYREYVNTVGIAEAARNRSLFTKTRN